MVYVYTYKLEETGTLQSCYVVPPRHGEAGKPVLAACFVRKGFQASSPILTIVLEKGTEQLIMQLPRDQLAWRVMVQLSVERECSWLVGTASNCFSRIGSRAGARRTWPSS